MSCLVRNFICAVGNRGAPGSGAGGPLEDQKEERAAPGEGPCEPGRRGSAPGQDTGAQGRCASV